MILVVKIVFFFTIWSAICTAIVLCINDYPRKRPDVPLGGDIVGMILNILISIYLYHLIWGT